MAGLMFVMGLVWPSVSPGDNFDVAARTGRLASSFDPNDVAVLSNVDLLM